MDLVFRCEPGGIRQLVKDIDEHPEALAFDFRQQFGLSITDIGGAVSWLEAVLLYRALRGRPGTETFAALQGHEYAMSMESRILADLIDSFRSANSKTRPKPYPRPWDRGKTKSKPPTVSQDTVRKALRARGYEL